MNLDTNRQRGSVIAEVFLTFAAIGAVFILCFAIVEAGLEWTKAPSQLTLLKDLGTIVGGGYVIYKLSTGWLVVNLSIALDVQRKALSAKQEHFRVKAILQKGDTDALWLEELLFHITDITDPTNPARIASLKPAASFLRTDLGPLCLAPKETTEFSVYTVVPAKSVIHVEVILKADRPFYDFPGKLDPDRDRKYAEYHSDTISLPV